MRKRLFGMVLLCILATLLSSCGQRNNTIQTMQLSQDQQIISELFSDHMNALQLFSYKTDADYRSVDVWVEVYKDGTLVNANSGGLFRRTENTTPTGEIAIITNITPDFQWTFIQRDAGGSMTRSVSKPCTYYKDGYGSAQMKDPVTIEDGKEIILSVTLFADESGGVRFIEDEQMYLQDPSLLKEYPFAHIFKCRFTK